LHVLVENRMLTRVQALDTINTVAEVLQEAAENDGYSPLAHSRPAFTIIDGLLSSFAAKGAS
jgi:hypothetical protein